MSYENMVDELKGTTGKGVKEEILDYYLSLRDSDFIKFLLREVFDPNLLHHAVLKKSDIPPPGDFSLGEVKRDVVNLFAELHLEFSSVKNKEYIRSVMEELTEESQLALFGVVNKKMRCGISVKTVNKVSPDLVEVIPIALAKSYDPKKEHRYSSQFYCSDKLDGQRVFCIRDHRKWKKHSRAGDYLGNKITTLDHWDDELEHYYDKTGISFLDGEAYRHGMTFEEIRTLVGSNVNKKDATVLEYHVFFAGKTLDLKIAAEQNSIMGILPETLYQAFSPYRYLVGVKQKRIINDESAIYEKIDDAVGNGYEGVVLRSTDVLYDFKRSHNLLKAKKSDLSGTIEYIDAYVEDMEYGEFTVREDGREEIENLPVALWVTLPQDKSTKQMKVGSGFSLQQRREWLEDESLIIGKMIEVQYQGFGAKGRMRFPSYERTRDDL